MTTHRPPIRSFLLALVLLVAVAASGASPAGADVCNGVCLRSAAVGLRGSGRLLLKIQGAFKIRATVGSLDALHATGDSISVSGVALPVYYEPAPGPTPNADPTTPTVPVSGEMTYIKHAVIRGFCLSACTIDLVAEKFAAHWVGSSKYVVYGHGGWSDSFGHSGVFCSPSDNESDCMKATGDAYNSVEFWHAMTFIRSGPGNHLPTVQRTAEGQWMLDGTTMTKADAMRRAYATLGDGANPPIDTRPH